MSHKVRTTATAAGRSVLSDWDTFSTPIAAGADAMVLEAVSDLADENGSTLQTVKLYIEASYDVDVHNNKFATSIHKALLTQVKKGRLTKTTMRCGTTSYMLQSANKSAQPKSQKKAKATAASVKKLKKAGSDGAPKLTKGKTACVSQESSLEPQSETEMHI